MHGFMKENYKLLLSDNVIRVSLVFSFVLLVMLGVLLFFFYKSLPPYIPILNSLSWGESRLLKLEYIFVIPSVMVLVVLLNNIFAYALYKRNPLLARISSFNALLFSLLSFLAVIEVLFLVY